MSSHEHGHDLQKEIRGYLIIGGSLLFLTVVTVGVSYIHLNLAMGIFVAMVIATFKASLVACYFMHLISEKKLIYIILTCTVIFIAGLPAGLILGEKDLITGTISQSQANESTKTERSPAVNPGVHH